MDTTNSSGKIFISHTVGYHISISIHEPYISTDFSLWFFLQQVLSGKFVLRFAVGAPLTEGQHVDAAWKLLQDEATKLLGSA
jgi:tyrosine decarboxylase